MKTNKSIVKKIGLIALAALFAASIAACKPQQSQTQTPAPNAPISGDNAAKVTMPPNATPAPIHDLNGFSYQFVRISYSESANSMTPYVINTPEKLREVVAQSMNTHSKTSLDEFMKNYDEEFFKTKYILVFNLTFSSGSVVPSVKSVTLDNGTVNIVTDGAMQGDVGTADMASHMCLLALDAERFPEASAFSVTGLGTTQSGVDKKR